MPAVTVNGRWLSYEIAGDGFPLLLVPDTHGTINDWAPSMPLLGELCRVIAYAYTRPAPLSAPTALSQARLRLADLVAFLDVLDVQRVYLAGYACGGQTALHFALDHPKRLEGLVLIGLDNPLLLPSQEAAGAEMLHPMEATSVPSLQLLTVPTLLLAGEYASGHLAWAAQLATCLACGVKGVVAGAGEAPHREQPLQLGHEILRFLLRCERQRNLVRGASFLL
jgi:pimeloyl-ACP methyl ester carboxylesterase